MITYGWKIESYEYFTNLTKSCLCKKYQLPTRLSIYSIGFTLLLSFFPLTGFAGQTMTIPMDLVSWKYSGDAFQCNLSQPVSPLGTLRFAARPNRPLSLQLVNPQAQSNWSNAELFQQAAPWQKTSLTSQSFGLGKVNRDGLVHFESGVETLLSRLASGSWIRLELDSTQAGHQQSVQIPSTRIQSAVARFNQCRAKLPQMAFTEARDLVLQFNFGQRVVSAAQRQQLQALASYVRVDSEVNKVLIDGHTDNVGNAIANLQIARVRADDVASVLVELGLPVAKLEVRAHGDRYPVASNRTKQGQAKNRRVTVRLIRSEQAVAAAQGRPGKLKTEVQ